MDFNKFTEKSQEAVASAQSLATRGGQQQVEVEHLLMALLDQEGGLAGKILGRVGVNVSQLRQGPALPAPLRVARAQQVLQLAHEGVLLLHLEPRNERIAQDRDPRDTGFLFVGPVGPAEPIAVEAQRNLALRLPVEDVTLP